MKSAAADFNNFDVSVLNFELFRKLNILSRTEAKSSIMASAPTEHTVVNGEHKSVGLTTADLVDCNCMARELNWRWETNHGLLVCLITLRIT